MNEYLELYLNENEFLKNIPQQLRDIKLNNLHLNDKELLKKINKDIFSNIGYEFFPVHDDEYCIVKKKNRFSLLRNKNRKELVISKIDIKTNSINHHFSIKEVEFFKKTEQAEFRYGISEDRIFFHCYPLNDETRTGNYPFDLFLNKNCYLFSYTSESNIFLTNVFSYENLQSDPESMKIIMDSILLDKKIDPAFEDLMLLNHDMDFKRFRNDISIINILEKKFIENKSKNKKIFTNK